MNLEIFKTDSGVRMSSREIAEITGKPHNDLLKESYKSYGAHMGKNDWEKFPSR